MAGMLFQGGAPPNILLTGVIVTALPSFAGTALGKYLRHRNRDPFDPLEPRG